MMGQEGLAELGVAGIALVAIIMLIDFIRKRIGNGKKTQTVLECPNKIERLDATLIALVNQSGEQTRLNTEQLKVLITNTKGIERLVDQHKPDASGREMWKWTSRSERMQEESRDLLREIVQAMKNRP